MEEPANNAKRLSTLVLAAMIGLTSALAGCSNANKGGDTTCAEFKKMSSTEQKALAKVILKKAGTQEPGAIEVTGYLLVAKLFCETLGSGSSKLNEMPKR